jgi:hypothetical protein
LPACCQPVANLLPTNRLPHLTQRWSYVTS